MNSQFYTTKKPKGSFGLKRSSETSEMKRKRVPFSEMLKDPKEGPFGTEMAFNENYQEHQKVKFEKNLHSAEKPGV